MFLLYNISGVNMIYKNEKEMKEKMQEEVEQARRTVAKDKRILYLKRFIRIIVICSIILGLVLLRNKYGEIEIKSSSLTIYGIEFEKPYSPIYRIEINDNVIDYYYTNDKVYTLIPYFVKFHNIETVTKKKTNSIKYSNNLSLDITAALCKSKNVKGEYVEACYYSDPIYETVNTDIKSIKITSNNNVIYNGIYNNNLNDYIKGKGTYAIEVESNYNNVTTTLIFDLEVI